MAIFKTNREVKFATEKEVNIYYKDVTKKINLLLEKYDIRNADGELEKVSSLTGFFQTTPLKAIFFDQKQPFVPHEIIYTFRSIISHPPVNIKAIFLNRFIALLTEKGWDKPLGEYFEKQYNFSSDGVIILDDLEDFSLGFGVYKVTFQLRTARREKIIVFLKKPNDSVMCNELLYSHLQKELLSTARHVKLPCILLNKKNREALLLSPLVQGLTSDAVLSALENKKTLEILIEAFMSHAALGDILGRNDRHLMNSLIAFVGDNPNAISLIDIDLKWLLEEKNTDWALADIDFGLSELNLLSLLPEFNDYNSKTNLFFEKRKEYIAHYFNLYCQQQKAILKKKKLLFSAIKNFYPADMAKKKRNVLMQRINIFEKNNKPIIELFKRYLLNFRIRLVYKETLIALARVAKKSNYPNLLKYIPP